MVKCVDVLYYPQRQDMTALTQAVFEDIPYPFFTMNELKHLLPGTDSSRYARINRALQAKEIIQVRQNLRLAGMV